MTSSTQEPDLATEGDVIKDRWKIIKKLGGGGFGEIYECLDINSKLTVAIKLESSKLTKQVLRMEVSVLKKLQGTKHACKCYGYGRNDKFSYVAMTRQGKNLADLRRQMKSGCFSVSTTFQLTSQILDAIESIHTIGFLHRDIKPSNFAMGGSVETKRIVYMLDFGLARQYVLPSSNNGSGNSLDVRPPREMAGFRGTVRYASVNAHLNLEMGRHDDLWSAFYMIVEMITGQLPWRRIKDKEQVGEMKKTFDHTRLLQPLPMEMQGFLTHVQSLDYYKKPDYELLRNYIRQCMDRMNISMSDSYDWEIQTNNTTTATPPSGTCIGVGGSTTAVKGLSIKSSKVQQVHMNQQPNQPFNQPSESAVPEETSNVSRLKRESVMKLKKYASVENAGDNNVGQGGDNAISASGKSSYRHISNATAKSEKSHNARGSMPPLSPRSAFSTVKDRQMETKFIEDIDTPRNVQPVSDVMNNQFDKQNRESVGSNQRRKKKEMQNQYQYEVQVGSTPVIPTLSQEPSSKPSRLPVLVKSNGASTDSNNKSNEYEQLELSTGRRKQQYTQQNQDDNNSPIISKVTSTTPNLPPKPMATSTNVITSGNKFNQNNSFKRSGINFLQSIGGSIATNAVNDEQFDVSNAPDATKAVHLTQMSNQDDGDDDDDPNAADSAQFDGDSDVMCIADEGYHGDSAEKKSIRNEAIEKLLNNDVDNKNFSKGDSERSVNKPRNSEKLHSNKQTVAKIQAQLTDKSRASSSIQSRLANNVGPNEEDSSNCKSKESHELEMTFSRAKTSTSGYVSSGIGVPTGTMNLGSGDQHYNQQNDSIDGGFGCNSVSKKLHSSHSSSARSGARSTRPRSGAENSNRKNSGVSPSSVSSHVSRLPPKSNAIDNSTNNNVVALPANTSNPNTTTSGTTPTSGTPNTKSSRQHHHHRHHNYHSHNVSTNPGTPHETSDISVSRSSRRGTTGASGSTSHSRVNISSTTVQSQQELKHSSNSGFHHISSKDSRTQQLHHLHHNFQNINYHDHGVILHQNRTVSRVDSRQCSVVSEQQYRHGIQNSNNHHDVRPTPKPRSHRNNGVSGSNHYHVHHRSQSQRNKDNGIISAGGDGTGDNSIYSHQHYQPIHHHRNYHHRSSSRDDSINNFPTSNSATNLLATSSKYHHNNHNYHHHHNVHQSNHLNHRQKSPSNMRRRSTSFCSSADSSLATRARTPSHRNSNTNNNNTATNISTNCTIINPSPSAHPNKSLNDLLARANYYTSQNAGNSGSNPSNLIQSPKRSMSINRSQSADILNHLVRKHTKTFKNTPSNTTTNRHSYKRVIRRDEIGNTTKKKSIDDDFSTGATSQTTATNHYSSISYTSKPPTLLSGRYHSASNNTNITTSNNNNNNNNNNNSNRNKHYRPR